MPFQKESEHFDGSVAVVAPRVFRDERGFFLEAYRKDLFEELGLPGEFVQWNHSGSSKGVIRGLHFQWEPPMSKLMRVTRGRAFLVAIDIRVGSPTQGEWFGIECSEENFRMLWAVSGFARGFCCLEENTEIEYLCTGTYNPEGESGIHFQDPDIGVDWPDVGEPLVSEKDRNAQSLKEWLARPEARNFSYKQ